VLCVFLNEKKKASIVKLQLLIPHDDTCNHTPKDPTDDSQCKMLLINAIDGTCFKILLEQRIAVVDGEVAKKQKNYNSSQSPQSSTTKLRWVNETYIKLSHKLRFRPVIIKRFPRGCRVSVQYLDKVSPLVSPAMSGTFLSSHYSLLFLCYIVLTHTHICKHH